MAVNRGSAPPKSSRSTTSAESPPVRERSASQPGAAIPSSKPSRRSRRCTRGHPTQGGHGARERERGCSRAVATDPCPEGLLMWRGREASPGFGPRGSPSRRYVSGVLSTRTAPVTVAGPRRTCTGFRNSRPRTSIVPRVYASRRSSSSARASALLSSARRRAYRARSSSLAFGVVSICASSSAMSRARRSTGRGAGGALAGRG